MFFGNPVALAAGGAALFSNLRTAMFPGTDFRSAFAQFDGTEGMTLCTKNLAAKSKMRSAYLWAYRVPEVKKPAVSFPHTPHVPLGANSVIPVKYREGSSAKELALARDWRLTPSAGGASIPVGLTVQAGDSVELDLAKSKAAAGEYELSAAWDWDSLSAGTVDVQPYGDFARVTLAPGERDKLVEGNGTVAVKLTGADFEFLEKAAIESSAADAKPVEAGFTLPMGKRAGPQDSVIVKIDTVRQGTYKFLLTQSDGVAHEVPVTVLPPNPKISNLPVRLNLGEAREAIHLHGTGLDRIDAVSSDAGSISGAPGAHGWSGEIALNHELEKGQKLWLMLKVQGLDQPLRVRDAFEVVGPRPKIVSVQKSLARAPGVEISADELPAGTAAGLVLRVDHLDAGAQPQLQLGCEGDGLRKALRLLPSESTDGASLTFSGAGSLYLSVDPGTVGYAGCRLSASVMLEPEGRSDQFVLGRVVRVPRLDKFDLTSEKVGDSSYAGILEGRDLDVVEKVGWDAEHGVAVGEIPTPVPGDLPRQTLRVVLPWPAPAPHAPLYIWLRGETAGRKAAVAY